MSLDQTQKDKIVSALAQLDHSNSQHWTDDGLPRTGVVQKFAGDTSISRTDINDAAPGFARQAVDAEQTVADTESTTVEQARGEGVGGAPAKPIEPIAPVGQAPDDGGTVLAFEDEERAKYRRAVVDAETAYEQSLRDLETARKTVLTAKANIEKSTKAEAERFPPLTAGQNIQNFLHTSHAERVANAERMKRMGIDLNNPAYAPANRGMGAGRRVGSTKPYFFGPPGADGKATVITPVSASERTREAMRQQALRAAGGKA